MLDFEHHSLEKNASSVVCFSFKLSFIIRISVCHQDLQNVLFCQQAPHAFCGIDQSKKLLRLKNCAKDYDRFGLLFEPVCGQKSKNPMYQNETSHTGCYTCNFTKKALVLSD